MRLYNGLFCYISLFILIAYAAETPDSLLVFFVEIHALVSGCSTLGVLLRFCSFVWVDTDAVRRSVSHLSGLYFVLEPLSPVMCSTWNLVRRSKSDALR